MEYPRIRSWIEEWGGGVDYVDYLKSHGDLATIAAFVRVLWPEFIETAGCILWDRVYEEENFNLWRQSLSGDIQKIEATLNRLPVWQLVESEDSVEDREALRYISIYIAKAWRAALAAEFPHRTFDVRVIESEDGPIVTFSSRTGV